MLHCTNNTTVAIYMKAYLPTASLTKFVTQPATYMDNVTPETQAKLIHCNIFLVCQYYK